MGRGEGYRGGGGRGRGGRGGGGNRGGGRSRGGGGNNQSYQFTNNSSRRVNRPANNVSYEDTPSAAVHPGSYASELSSLLSSDQAAELEAAKAAALADSRVKRKVALLTAYCGSDFQGMQINKGARTVEAEIEKAVFLAGGISTSNFGAMGKVGWTR
jgi:hypothetical protein